MSRAGEGGAAYCKLVRIRLHERARQELCAAPDLVIIIPTSIIAAVRAATVVVVMSVAPVILAPSFVMVFAVGIVAVVTGPAFVMAGPVTTAEAE